LEFVMENNGDLSVLKNFHNIKKHDTPWYSTIPTTI
jgi:hypothetical protein